MQFIINLNVECSGKEEIIALQAIFIFNNYTWEEVSLKQCR